MPDYIRELVRVWREGDFALDLYDSGQTRDGKAKLEYRFWHRNDLIFSGADFFCSPLHAIDSDETLAALLTFLSLRPGDTDAEYFESYDDDQLRWAQTYGEELSLYAYELENPDD